MKHFRSLPRVDCCFLHQFLELSFKHKMLDAGKSLCCLLKMVFIAFPQDGASTPPDIKLLYQKVSELIQKHVHAVTASQTAGDDNSLSSISFVLIVLKTLAEVQKNFVDPYVLVRILQRLSRDLGSAAGAHPRQVSYSSLITTFFLRDKIISLLSYSSLNGFYMAFITSYRLSIGISNASKWLGSTFIHAL